MQYSFDYSDIKQQVLDFMRSLGIQPHDERDIQIDGVLHRYRTHDDKNYSMSGAYCIHPDGIPAGFVQDWRKGIKEDWCFSMSGFTDEERTYFNSEEFKKKAAKERKEAEKKRKEKQIYAIECARRIWDSLTPAPDNHKYLISKKVKNYGLHYRDEDRAIAVPLRDISGNLQTIQWINEEGGKRFQSGAPTDKAFYAVALDLANEEYTGAILLAEGYATAAKLYSLTGLPTVAAIMCGALETIAKILKQKYSKAVILIMADDDRQTEIERGFNPGLREAKKVVDKKLAKAVISPPFKSPNEGTDWDDYAIIYGDEFTASRLKKRIAWECMSEEEKEEYMAREALSLVVHDLDPTIKLPPQEFIGGIFPCGFVSMLIAPPGTGKTVFMQKFVSDISVGGNVFDGFIDEEPERKCLILAGEAGYELLIRRGASMKWSVRPSNVKVFDQYEAELKGIDTMLDSPEGMKNVERLIDIYKPSIVFIDTFSSFHESDENKAPEMKPIIKKLAALARRDNMALVLVHHSRKRTAKERTLSLNQDDVIGSSIMNRLVGLIIGIEPMKDDEKVLLVRPLKSWFSSFTPFTYTLKESLYGGTVLQTDLAPAGVNNSKSAVWYYLTQNFEAGEWFNTSQIVLSEIETSNVTDWQLRRILADFVKNGKLERRGAKKSLEYSILRR